MHLIGAAAVTFNGEVRLGDRKFGLPRRAIATRPAPKHFYKPRLGLNDISVLSKSCYGRNLSRDKAVMWRMLAKSFLVKESCPSLSPSIGIDVGPRLRTSFSTLS